MEETDELRAAPSELRREGTRCRLHPRLPLRRRSLSRVLVNLAAYSGRICRAAVGPGVRAIRTRR
jgi:hypothetical protein